MVKRIIDTASTIIILCVIVFLLYAMQINNSESAARNTSSRCEGQKIPFFRFSPFIEEEVSLSETDDEALVNMILKARADLISKQSHMDVLVQSFYK